MSNLRIIKKVYIMCISKLVLSVFRYDNFIINKY